MRLFLTGATGLVGRRLIVDRLARGDRVVALTRDGHRASDLFAADANPNVEIVTGDPRVPGPWQRAMEGCDAVVHLAGAGVADRRWSRARRRTILDSRIDGTFQVVEAMRGATVPPPILVSASATGFYGDVGSRETDEHGAAASDDFLAAVCVEWERQAARARELGARVVHLRTGIVLDARGGAVAQMLPPFRLGLGGPLGHGRQYMPWIHWRDEIGLIDLALRDGRIDGPLNAVAPNPATGREVADAIGAALGKPSFLAVPRPLLRLVAGPIARHLVQSQRIVPARALDAGYRFRFPELRAAIEDVLRPAVEEDASPSPSPPPRVALPRPDRRPRLVAIGADGALLGRDARIPAALPKLCAEIQEAECVVVIVTGRPPRAARSLLDALGIVAPLVAYGGAAIWNPKRDAAQHHLPLDPALAREVVARARAAVPEVLVGIERLDRWSTDRIDESLRRSLGAAVAPDETGPIEALTAEPVTQLDLLAPAAAIDRVRAALAEGPWAEGRVALFRPAPTLLRVVHPMADPAIALQRIAGHLGAVAADVVAISGAAADAGMLEWAGTAIALADADARTRSLADAVADAPGGAGIVAALRTSVIPALDAAGGAGS